MPIAFMRSRPGGAFSAAAVAALLGGASAAFAQCPATFTVGPAWTMGSPYSVSVGDFNADGRLDFATANFTGAGDASVRLADMNAANNYLNISSYPLGLSPRGSVAGDFNHDGRADLAVAYNGGGPANVRLAVLIANANGTFQTPVLYPVGWQAYDVIAADVNADGNIDLLCTSSAGTISILRGNADGTFQDAVTVTLGVQPTGLVVADVNGDGTKDLVATNYNFSTGVSIVYVALGVPGSNGAGYGTFNPYSPGSFGSWGIASGDFNGDTRADVVITHRISGSAQVLLSNADGSLAPQTARGTGQWPQAVVTGDFNGDGKLDAAVGNWGGSNVTVLLGNGAGGLGSNSNFTVGTNPNWLVAADMNNDGKPDIVVANQQSGTVQILYNTTPVTTFPLQPFPQRVCPGGGSTATFTARGTTTQAGGVTGYRWERFNGASWETLAAGPLAGVGTVSFAGGTNGDPTTLFIANVQGNAGDTVARVRAVVLNSCGATPSNEVTLSLIRRCGPADIGGPGGLPSSCGDGYLDNNDFIAFITYFFNGSSIADFGQAGGFAGADGSLNNNDFVAFINAFFAGCP